MIDEYLNELHAHLRLSARRRRRIVAEVKDHLECTATELRAEGLDAPEREAITRFGPASELAQTFLEQEAARGGMRASLASGLLGALIGLLLTAAPGRPLFVTVFPSGVVAFVLGQVALVAGLLTFARGLAGGRLALILRGGLVVLACATVAVVYGTARAIAVDAGWVPLAMLALATVATVVTVVRGLQRARMASLSLAAPEQPNALGDIHAAAVVALRRARISRAATLVQALPQALERRVPWTGALDLRRHPWRFAIVVSIGAGLAAALGHGLTEEPTVQHLSRQLLAGAIIAGVEALASLLGFAVLGRYLGLRSGTAAPSPEP
jgi:HAAS domain-containing protein